MLLRIADLTWRRPKLALGLIAALSLFSIVVAHDVQRDLKAAGFTDSASQSERATATLNRALGFDPNPAIVLLVRGRHGEALNLQSPVVRAEVRRLSDGMSHVENIGHVEDPIDDPRTRGDLLARDGRSLVISGYLSTAEIEDAGGVAAEHVRPLLRSRALRVSMGGFAPSFNEVNDRTRSDLNKAELIAFPLLALMLLVVFRGLIAAGIPLLIGGISIVCTLLVLRIMSLIVDTSLFALNITTALSLGLAVDYALLLVSRYREEISRGSSAKEAHQRTVQTAGRTVIFSGCTVAAAMAALVLFPQRFLYSIGVAGAAVGVLCAVIALLVVPSLLALLGPRIDSLSIRRGPAVYDESSGWYRAARAVMRHPIVVALASAALLLAAASPLFSTQLTGPSAQAVPPGLASYETNTYLGTHYSRDVNEAVTVVLQGRVAGGQPAAVRQRILAIAHVLHGTPFVRASATVAYANFALDGPALSANSQRAVKQIRALATPSSSTILVTGNTASFIDQKSSLAQHLPLVVGLIAAITLILLFLLTGSVLLPLKTLLMNAMTLGATLGLIDLAFGHGILDGLFSYTGPAAIEVTSLVFLFAVIFGLATDYAVLVMARIKEQYERSQDNHEAVAVGIARTGRVITAAALMIAVVFLAFGVSSIFFMKQIALGMALGVLIDATIVRGLLVPALMCLLGEWNWWAPRVLRRVYLRLGLSEA